MAVVLKAQFSRLNNESVFGQAGVVPNATCAVIPSDFIRCWRRWLIRPGEAERPSNIDTQPMFCDHGNLVIDLSEKSDLDNDIAIVMMSEWDRLQDL